MLAGSSFLATVLVLLLPSAVPACTFVPGNELTACTSSAFGFGYQQQERGFSRIILAGATIGGSVGGRDTYGGSVGNVSLGSFTKCSTCFGTCSVAAPELVACPGDGVVWFRIPLVGSTATVCVGFGAALPFADNATSDSLVTLNGSALSVTIGGGPLIPYTAGAVATAASGTQLIALLLSDAGVGNAVFFSSCGPFIVKQSGTFTNLRASSGRGLRSITTSTTPTLCDGKTGLWCQSAKVLADCSKNTRTACPGACISKPVGFDDACGPAPSPVPTRSPTPAQTLDTVAAKCVVTTTGLMANGVCTLQVDCAGSNVAWIPATFRGEPAAVGCEALANTRCCIKNSDAMLPTTLGTTAATAPSASASAATTATTEPVGELLASSLTIRVAPEDATKTTTTGDSATTLIGSIVGGALAGVLVLLAGAVGFAWHRRRQRQQRPVIESKSPISRITPLATPPPPQPVEDGNEQSARYVQRGRDLMSMTARRTHVQYDALTAVESGRYDVVPGDEDEMRSARADDSLRVESLPPRYNTPQAPRLSTPTSHYDDIVDGTAKGQW